MGRGPQMCLRLWTSGWPIRRCLITSGCRCSRPAAIVMRRLVQAERVGAWVESLSPEEQQSTAAGGFEFAS